jgi:hypothetical protein
MKVGKSRLIAKVGQEVFSASLNNGSNMAKTKQTERPLTNE